MPNDNLTPGDEWLPAGRFFRVPFSRGRRRRRTNFPHPLPRRPIFYFSLLLNLFFILTHNLSSLPRPPPPFPLSLDSELEIKCSLRPTHPTHPSPPVVHNSHDSPEFECANTTDRSCRLSTKNEIYNESPPPLSSDPPTDR